jgi:hypothetical protein
VAPTLVEITKEKKCALVLKDCTDKASEPNPTTIITKWKGQKSKAQPTESGSSDDEATVVADNGTTMVVSKWKG